MPLILYFRSPTPNNASDEALVGIRRIAEHLKWHVRDINMPLSPVRMKQLVDYWRPFGIIFESGEWSLKVDVSSLGSTPIVFIDRDPDSIPRNSFNVLHDSVSAGQVAARELMLTNHGHFAFIPFYEQRLWSSERQTGFVDSLALNGLDCAVFQAPNARADTKLYRSKLRRFIAAQPKPCAIFAATDAVAAEVIAAATLSGLSIPNDISVRGVDNDTNVCDHTNPPLSSIEPDFFRGGNLAMLMLLAVMRDGAAFRGSRNLLYGDVRTVHRSSTLLSRPQRTDDPILAKALELIHQKACSGLKAAEVIRLFPTSRRLAELRFREAVGCSILEKIHAVRLERAKAMLKNPTQSLATIADFCGFKHPNSMRKFFLKATGSTLSAWRKRRASANG